ncbi:MAG TPA: hypothetical protein PLM49_00320, partial [Bacteroidales bacterium]|nr:hypothetical protein [Bacteroidales bacterium]
HSVQIYNTIASLKILRQICYTFKGTSPFFKAGEIFKTVLPFDCRTAFSNGIFYLYLHKL